MRKFFSFLAAIAVFFMVGQAWADDGGTIRRITGKMVDFSNTEGVSTTTLDVFDFGFGTSDWVRICVAPNSNPVPMYFRFGTATADHTSSGQYSRTGGSYVAADYATDRMTVPASSSTVFIQGQTGTYAYGRAIAVRPPLLGSDDAVEPLCFTEPWKTKGIVTHIASGIATVDIWGWTVDKK